MQADTPSPLVMPIAGGNRAQTSTSHQSLEEPYAAQTQHNACVAADVSGGTLPHSDIELTTALSNSPQHLQFLHQQAPQQSTDAGTQQLSNFEAKSITSSQKQSRRGGRGPPLGRSGRGRGRGRHRVTIE